MGDVVKTLLSEQNSLKKKVCFTFVSGTHKMLALCAAPPLHSL
jgi:hypothetical protein